MEKMISIGMYYYGHKYCATAETEWFQPKRGATETKEQFLL
jgi:hypothetical protein